MDWACGAVLTGDNGEFASPRWPYQYPSLSLCEWTIRAPYGCTIYLSFTSIELEEHIKGNCTSAYDRVEVFDGSTKNSSRLASLCGKKGIHAYKSSLNVLSVTFISDERVQERGFHAVYKFFYPPTTTIESTTAEDTTTTSTEKMTKEQTTSATITTETAAKIFPFNASHLSLIAMFVEPRHNNYPVDKSQQSQMIDQTTESESCSPDTDIYMGSLSSSLQTKIQISDNYFQTTSDNKSKKKTRSKVADLDEVMKKSVLTPDFEKQFSLTPYEESVRQQKKQRRKEREKTKGKNWYNMEAPEMTEEKKNDLMVVHMRKALDPKRFYKNNDTVSIPKYFQLGTVVESSADFYHSRVPKKQRKSNMVEELLADAEFRKYNKRKYVEIQEQKRKAQGPYKHMKRLKKNKR
ncbi:rRNA-processing protein fcf2,Deoxynucleotidyltransferase terminal-interacting protein 2 [Mytilus coruscus]|uniref:rRNA-processing protein fcf2,Deoxynucleotidyltransferase terminal-interacting protein 2 n=1 Tax=Mytilus coruscus TaxID=42192 RepID=A0A6J8A7V3_MYTCO|nr:rRNA-processing protein fcf2,Deoxynucleotidyltransferase terminal-interacting protein 2 [Mytilus coruscus]